jgi:hypothetical protein
MLMVKGLQIAAARRGPRGCPSATPEKGEGWQTGEGTTGLDQGYSLIAAH